VIVLGVAAFAIGAWTADPRVLYIAGGVALAIVAIVVWGRKPIYEAWVLRRHVPAIYRAAEEAARDRADALAHSLPRLPAGGGGDMWDGWLPHIDTFIDAEIAPRLGARARELLARREAVRKEVRDILINAVLRRMKEGGIAGLRRDFSDAG
jgi:hypothetical protein